MILWLLRLFPAFRFLESEKAHAEQIATSLQSANAALERENAWLREHLDRAESARDYAMKTMVNLTVQDKHGVPAVYPDAYTLPEIPISEPGPLESNRVSAFDVRKQAVDEYKLKLLKKLTPDDKQAS